MKLFIERYCHDWDQLAEGMKRHLTMKEAIVLHQQCALFCHFMGVFEKTYPRGQFPAARDKLRNVFLMGGMDGELQLQAETTVPPGDLQALGAFRTGLERSWGMMCLTSCLTL